MFLRCFLPVLLVLALSSCSATVTPIELTAAHPASPLAAEAPLAALPGTFSTSGSTTTERAPAPEPMDHSMHGMAAEPSPANQNMDHSQHDRGDEPKPTAESMDHSHHGLAPTHEATEAEPPADDPEMDHSAHAAATDADPPTSDGDRR